LLLRGVLMKRLGAALAYRSLKFEFGYSVRPE
jgi:hypothetical protein